MNNKGHLFRLFIVSLCLFLVMYSLPIFATSVYAAAITSASDTMTRLQISITNVTHTIVFTPATATSSTTGSRTGVQITILSTFTDTSLTTANFAFSQTGGSNCTTFTDVTYVAANDKIQSICTAGGGGTGAITVSITANLDNPSSTGSKLFYITTYNLGADNAFAGGDDTTLDTGQFAVPIVDDDTVNITGFIQASITFDIDTVLADANCDAAGGGNPCDSYNTSTDNAGYVVDLGEMNFNQVNISGTSYLHADSGTGAVNYIWFDLDTNAVSGAVVTMKSLNGLLQGPATNTIPAIVSGNNFDANPATGEYGVNLVSGTATTGSIIRNTSCDTATEYCAPSTTAASVFTTNSLPIAAGRVKMAVAAQPSSTAGTGTYTDQLTFIATGTF